MNRKALIIFIMMIILAQPIYAIDTGWVAFFDFGAHIDTGARAVNKSRGSCLHFDYTILLDNISPFIFRSAEVYIDSKKIATINLESIYKKYDMYEEEYFSKQIAPTDKNNYCYDNRYKVKNKYKNNRNRYFFLTKDLVYLIRVPVGLHEVVIKPKPVNYELSFPGYWQKGLSNYNLKIDIHDLSRLTFIKRIRVTNHTVHLYPEGGNLERDIGHFGWGNKGYDTDTFSINSYPFTNFQNNNKYKSEYGFMEFDLKFNKRWDIVLIE